MKYKVYYKNSRCVVYNTEVLYSLNMNKSNQKYPKHREEIESYISSMNEPTLNVSNNIATLTFDPIPEQMATWMVQSRTTFFQVVRLSGGGSSHSTSNYRRRATKKSVKTTFPYEWNWRLRGSTSNISIPSTQEDRHNRNITKSELTSGRIVRDISHLDNFKIGCNSDMVDIMRGDGGWFKQFYIGLIYFDSDNIPSLYKMHKYEIVDEY